MDGREDGSVYYPMRLLLEVVYLKNKKVTRYCDRVTNGFPCKERGLRFKRKLIGEEDGALKICKQLRDRMYARLLRWQDAPPNERDRLLPMEDDQYTAWSENARLARMEYLDGKLTAEEFLQWIDMIHELTSYETGKAELGTAHDRRSAAAGSGGAPESAGEIWQGTGRAVTELKRAAACTLLFTVAQILSGGSDR